MKKILTIVLISTITVLIGILGATLYVKIVANNISDTAMYRTAISFGMFIFILIIVGTFTAIEIVNVHAAKNIDSYIGKSELMRFLHNEIKRYNGDESMFLANDDNLILLLSEISSLYEIAKLQQQRKAMTFPSGKQPPRYVDMGEVIEQVKKQIKGIKGPSN